MIGEGEVTGWGVRLRYIGYREGVDEVIGRMRSDSKPRGE